MAPDGLSCLGFCSRKASVLDRALLATHVVSGARKASRLLTLSLQFGPLVSFWWSACCQPENQQLKLRDLSAANFETIDRSRCRPFDSTSTSKSPKPLSETLQLVNVRPKQRKCMPGPSLWPALPRSLGIPGALLTGWNRVERGFGFHFLFPAWLGFR